MIKTAICAIIKDEHRFLKEWIDWHLNLGFDAIHLFEDKGSESHEEIVKDYSNVFLRRYETDDEVRNLLQWQGNSHRQHVLYEWFGDAYQQTYDWVAFIDLDEFVVFHNGYTLEKLCEEFEQYSAVLLNWRMMGASGHIQRPTCGVMEAYTEVTGFLKQDYGYCYKSLCNLKKWKRLNHLHLANDAVNTNHGTDVNEISWNKVSLDHFFTKSWEDWCDRIFNRGGTLNGHRTLDLFFRANQSMAHLERELINDVAHMIPKGTYWLDSSRTLIAGGNVKKIMSLNRTL